MDVQIDITKDFEKDLKKMTKSDNQMISKKINYLIEQIRNDQSIGRNLYRLHKVSPIGNLDSSLYLLKINKTIRAIVTFEDDPLFDQKIITLVRVAHHDKIEKIFKGIQESFYQSFLRQRRENG